MLELLPPRDGTLSLFVTPLMVGFGFASTWRPRTKCAPRIPWRRTQRVVRCAAAPGGEVTGSNVGGIEEPILRPVGADGCSVAELARLAGCVSGWLNSEYPEPTLAEAHRVVGEAAAQHYGGVRSEGVDDLGAILMGLGGRLEGEAHLFEELFVGAWDVANKMSELVLALGTAKALPPVHGDTPFERYNFLQRLLDGQVDATEINGAVAQVAGYRFSMSRATWRADGVRDEHFKEFAKPPDVLGLRQIDAAEWCPTLRYMHAQLGVDEPTKKEECDTFVEALHGVEISRIRRADDHSHLWRKLETVVLWLHLFGDY